MLTATPQTAFAPKFDVPPELVIIAQNVKKGDRSSVTVRTLLGWFHFQRRGFYVVEGIRDCLHALDIETEPDFDAQWIDGPITFVPLNESSYAQSPAFQPDALISNGEDATIVQEAKPVLVGGGVEDPTYRIGKLAAANKEIVSVAPNHQLSEAVALMLANGFSQLPVMQGERDVKGVISWESIGARLALGRTCLEVRDCLSPAQIIGSEKSLFAAMDIIAQHQYVLVQATDRTISGIVTSTDLSLQFQQLTEPFLLLGEIEQHVRKLIVGKFTRETLGDARDPCGGPRFLDKKGPLP